MNGSAARWKGVSQGLFLGSFAVLFALASFPMPARIPVDAFLRLDPLIALSTALAARTSPKSLVVAGLVLGSALLWGRLFCGYICPLGTMLDVAEFALGKRLRKVPRPDLGLNRIRFGLLAFIGAAALSGSALLVWLSPLSLCTRFATNLAFPLMGRAAAGLGWTNYRPVILLDVVALTLCVLVFGSLFWQARFWCRNICPLGALLGLAGRFGFRPVVAQSCHDCGQCVTVCPMEAIEGNPKRVDTTRCHQCQECRQVCPNGRITLSRPRRDTPKAPSGLARSSRRNFLELCSAGAAGAALSHPPIRAVLQGGPKGRLLRPPGVFDEEAFLDLCVRCGECIKVCTYNCLQPVRFEQGWIGLGSPQCVMRIAGCDPVCAACGAVCPSGAIPGLSLQRKKRAIIGLAQINRAACLLWKEQLCDRCVQACAAAGYHAIAPSFEDGFMRIQVLADQCNGCGWCEHHCPVTAEARSGGSPRAITVIPSSRRDLDRT